MTFSKNESKNPAVEVPIRIRNGDPSLAEIGDTKGAEEAATKRTAALEAANKELETFTYTVSHDLKAPLRGIDGYSQLLLSGYADRLDENGVKFLHNLRAAAQRMDRLIGDLLEYSRLERGAPSLVLVKPREAIDAVLAEFAHEIGARNAAITACRRRKRTSRTSGARSSSSGMKKICVAAL